MVGTEVISPKKFKCMPAYAFCFLTDIPAIPPKFCVIIPEGNYQWDSCHLLDAQEA